MAFPRLVRALDPPEDALRERSDDELMQLSSAGLRAAFAVLVERYAVRIANLCSRFVNDGQLGRELAQDVWALAWQGRQKYRGDGTFGAWLVTVARNHCRNELRRRKQRGERVSPSVDEEAAQSARQLDRLLTEERRRRVRAALEELPLPLREALLLRFGEGLRYDEIASVVGTGESTLRSRVHHGLRALKEKLEKDR